MKKSLLLYIQFLCFLSDVYKALLEFGIRDIRLLFLILLWVGFLFVANSEDTNNNAR